MTLALTETKQMEYNTTPAPTINLQPSVDHALRLVIWRGYDGYGNDRGSYTMKQMVKETLQPLPFDTVLYYVNADNPAATKMEKYVNIAVASAVCDYLTDFAESLRI